MSGNNCAILAADASRLAALLVAHIVPLCSLLTPCQPGASAPRDDTPISGRALTAGPICSEQLSDRGFSREDDAVASLFFRAIERHVGAADEGGHVDLGGLRHRDTEAGGDVDRQVVPRDAAVGEL